MVDFVDIHNVTLEELSGIVELYPWYGGARIELSRRMSKLGMLSESQLAQTALYIASRKLAAQIPMKAQTEALPALSSNPPSKKKVYVVGGDYFSQEEYNAAREKEDSVFADFARAGSNIGVEKQKSEAEEDICTETLAKIYLEQEYKQEAIEIYSKLSLRYPEKSVYFASLIEEIKQKEI